MPTLLALILPFLLLGGAAGPPRLRESPPETAAPGDSMRSHVTRQFELYAPTDHDLRVANSEIHMAVTQFAFYLGEAPKKMAFVLFRSAAEADRYDYSPLTKRGMRVLPWVAATNPRGGRARGGEPQLAEGGSRDNPHPLSHEVGHSLLNTYVDRSLAALRAAGAGDFATDSGGAGAGPPGANPPNAGAPGPGSVVTARHPDHPVLPDWLEEAVAALCEPPSLQQRRIEFMRTHLDRRIPLAELLTMRRPNTGGPKSGRGRAAGADGAAIFTAEALSLARFIAQREQHRLIGAIVVGVIRGRTVGEVLNTGQSLFSKPEPLEKQWLEWMESPSRAP